MDIVQKQQQFWQFSCGLYKNPALKALLHQLQNERNANINWLLFAAWLAIEKNRALTVSEVSQIKITTKLLESWIINIRHIRNQMKTDRQNCALNPDTFVSLREQMIDCELEFEKEHQRLIVSRYFGAKDAYKSRTEFARKSTASEPQNSCNTNTFQNPRLLLKANLQLVLVKLPAEVLEQLVNMIVKLLAPE
ncbi:TIGR02444 family protein [Aliikangiella sp. G2MR2-5]|uniref:TIGR02444 family protein n=1 Tax=Aliikangiella sp. G2MR2-5 TaxID=2788943 RepID=UPI0018AC2463|nr:TIGR02444 family protein [Aliikangiella sp. G2MR2-5]